MLGIFPVLIYYSYVPLVSLHPVVGGFLENLEAIEHFEKVFDSAAVSAGAKDKLFPESERRWDSEGVNDEHPRESRQVDFSMDPSESRTIFRDDDTDLRINIRGNRRQRLRNLSKFISEKEQFSSSRGRFSSNSPGLFKDYKKDFKTPHQILSLCKKNEIPKKGFII